MNSIRKALIIEVQPIRLKSTTRETRASEERVNAVITLALTATDRLY